MKVAVAFLLALCYLATTGDAWTCVEGPRLSGVTQLDAGLGQVVATTTSKYVYYMMGNRWYRMSNYRMGHVTVGLAGIFGSGWRRYVYKYVCGSFKRVRGRYMKQVDAGGDDSVVGVTRANRAFCATDTNTLAYKGVGTMSWVNLNRRLKYYSCNKVSCWGVDRRNRVYIAKSVNAGNCQTRNWQQVTGSLKMVEAATDGKVFGVTPRGLVLERIGITAARPHGLSWRTVPMCTKVRHVSSDHGKLWVVTNSHLVLKCT